MDHEAQCECIKRYRDVEEPPVKASVANGIPDDEEKNTGHDGKGIVDVAGLRNGEVEDHLQEGLEV